MRRQRSRRRTPLLALILVLLGAALPGGAQGVADTDGDGLRDTFETAFGLDPARRDTDGDGLHDPSEDEDEDGLGVLGEQRAGTSPLLADSDADGRPDGRDDADGDGVADGLEQDRRPVPRDLRPRLARAEDDRASLAMRCETVGRDTTVRVCPQGDRDAPITVVMVGDSHAAQWMPAFGRAGAAAGWRFIALSKSGCPAPDLGADDSSVDGSCRPWRRKVERWLAAHRPDLVILTAAPQYHLLTPGGERRKDGAKAWAKAYARTIRAMPDGVPVVLLHEIPRPRVDVPACLRAHRLLSACATRRGAARRDGYAKRERAAAASTGARWASLGGLVCPYDPCPVVSDGMLIYRDAGHLTRTFSRSLWPAAARLVADSLPPAPLPDPLRAAMAH